MNDILKEFGMLIVLIITLAALSTFVSSALAAVIMTFGPLFLVVAFVWAGIGLAFGEE